MNVETEWRCKTCNDFTEHSGIEEDTAWSSFIVYTGKCTSCGTSNLNAFNKKMPNPIFGRGTLEKLKEEQGNGRGKTADR